MRTFIEGTQRGYAYGIKSDDETILIESYVHWDNGRTLGDVYDETRRKLTAIESALKADNGEWARTNDVVQNGGAA